MGDRQGRDRRHKGMERAESEKRKSRISLFKERCSEYMHSWYLTWQQIHTNIKASIDLSGRLNFCSDGQSGLAGFFHVRPALAGFSQVPTKIQKSIKINPIFDRVNFCTQQGDASMLMKPNNFDLESTIIQEHLLQYKADKIIRDNSGKLRS